MPAMISSAAFPKVAFRSPPSPSPTRVASASVARPIQPAAGMIAMAEQMKSAVGLPSPGQKRRASAIGMKIRSQFSGRFMFMLLSVSVASPSSLRLVVGKLETRATLKPASPMEETALEVVRRLRAAGHVAYYAGGSVRDLLRGQVPKDIDIATDARPEAVQKIFSRTYAVGAHFGVIVVLENELQFEVATFRSDDVY